MANTDERVGISTRIDARMGQARALARLLDSAIRVPGTGIRFGLDSLLGVIPGLGDAAGAVFSGYLVLLAAQLGVPKPLIARMVANVAIDTVVGGIPVLGDLFDVAWKSNTRNLALLESYIGAPPARHEPPTGKGFVIGAIALIVLLLVGGIWLAFVVVNALVGAIG